MKGLEGNPVSLLNYTLIWLIAYEDFNVYNICFLENENEMGE
jgi:hypothetical protein